MFEGHAPPCLRNRPCPDRLGCAARRRREQRRRRPALRRRAAPRWARPRPSRSRSGRPRRSSGPSACPARRLRFRIDSRDRRIRVRVVLRRPRSRRTVAAISLGARRTGRLHAVKLNTARLASGRYVLGLSARDGRGRRLRRARGVRANRVLKVKRRPRPAPTPAPLPPVTASRSRAPSPTAGRARGSVRRAPVTATRARTCRHRPARPRRAVARHGEGCRLPGERGRALPRAERRGREPRLRVHAPAHRLHPGPEGGPGEHRASAWAPWAAPARRAARTCTSRSGWAAGTAAESRSTRCRC